MIQEEGEKLVLEEGASRFKNFIATGGILNLTTEKLCFRGKPGTEGKCDVEIKLSNINDVTSFKTLNINPNGLTIMLQDGEIEHFVVDDRKKWQKAISRCLQTIA
jgi:hypothetical protein